MPALLYTPELLNPFTLCGACPRTSEPAQGPPPRSARRFRQHATPRAAPTYLSAQPVSTRYPMPIHTPTNSLRLPTLRYDLQYDLQAFIITSHHPMERHCPDAHAPIFIPPSTPSRTNSEHSQQPTFRRSARHPAAHHRHHRRHST